MIVFIAVALVTVQTPVFAGDAPPSPAAPAIVASKDVQGTGKRADPFVFTSATKCVLRLQCDPMIEPEWDVDDAPSDIEPVGNVLVFSLVEPGTYQVINKAKGAYCRCWLEIVGPRGPPQPEDQITSRVKAALAGQPKDAATFKAACDGLAAALTAGEIKTLGQMEDAFAAALKANGWPTGRYPDLSRLSGELWGSGVADEPIDVATKTKFIASLKTVSAACAGVK